MISTLSDDWETWTLDEVEACEKCHPEGTKAFQVKESGKPFSIVGFGNWFRDRCDQAGLRQAGATRAAENGATAHQLMSMYGWKTLQEAEHYTNAAERRKLAASGMPLLLEVKKGT